MCMCLCVPGGAEITPWWSLSSLTAVAVSYSLAGLVSMGEGGMGREGEGEKRGPK